MGPHGIRVNTVSPRLVATDLWLGAGGVAQAIVGAVGSTPDAVATAPVADTPTGRFTEPAEVADLVLFLAVRAPKTSPAPTAPSTAA